MISDLLKKSEAYKEFSAAAASGKASHAYLVIGDDTVTRKAYMILLAATLLCKRGGLYECETCNRITAGSHPDVHIYNSDGKMRVEDTNTLISEASMRSWADGAKLFFIDRAESLSPAVQNKLLKLVEEPEGDAVIIFFASSEVPILPTVKSRTKKCYLPLFAPDEIFAELCSDGVPRAQAEIAAALSGGSFERAYKLGGDEDYVRLYEGVFAMLVGCRKSQDIAKYLGSELFTKENIGLTLDFTEIILKDALIRASGSGAKLTTRNRDYDLDEIASGTSAGALAMAILAVNKARKMLSANVGAVTVAETMLFDILEAKYKWR